MTNGLEKAKKLTELIERVKAATGPDRVLDRIIQVRIVNGGTGAFKTEQAWLVQAARDNWNTPAYTASIDAIVALIERKLPEHSVLMGLKQTDITLPWARIGEWNAADAACPTLPLALCLAFLTALQSLDTGGGGA